jgi:hypothetical protein
MKVVPLAEDAFLMDQPRAMVVFNYPLMGREPESRRPSAPFWAVRRATSQARHRQGFKQIRLPMIGDMHLGEQGTL